MRRGSEPWDVAIATGRCPIGNVPARASPLAVAVRPNLCDFGETDRRPEATNGISNGHPLPHPSTRPRNGSARSLPSVPPGSGSGAAGSLRTYQTNIASDPSSACRDDRHPPSYRPAFRLLRTRLAPQKRRATRQATSSSRHNSPSPPLRSGQVSTEPRK